MIERVRPVLPACVFRAAVQLRRIFGPRCDQEGRGDLPALQPHRSHPAGSILQVMKDIVTIMSDLIGGRSEMTGRVLHELITAGLAPSVADLARIVGSSESSVLRTVDQLAALGLVGERRSGRQRLLHAEKDSPFYRPLREVLFLLYGTVEHDPLSARFPDQLPPLAGRSLPYEFSEVASLIPEDLHPTIASGDPGDLDAHDGLTAVEARAQAMRLARLIAPYNQLHDLLQSAYYTWHNERDRDLVHRTIHVGHGLRRARSLLTTAADSAQYGGGEPLRVGRATWTAAVFCLAAEQYAVCAYLADWCAHAVNLARKLKREQVLLEEDVEELKRTDELAAEQGRVSSRRGELEGGIAERREAIIDLEHELRGYYRVGGLSSMSDVGTAGERLIAKRFEGVVASVTEEIGRMSAHITYEPWRAALERMRSKGQATASGTTARTAP